MPTIAQGSDEMESKIDWSKAPEGYPIWIEDLAPSAGFDGSGWHRDDGDRYTDEGNEYWLKPEEGYYRIHERPSPAWSGEGKPPVGGLIEALWSASRDVWLKTIVFSFDEHGQPIHRWEEGPKKYEYQATPLVGMGSNKPYFRPIRTPEQIAEDDREVAIKEMTANYAKDSGVLAGWAAYVYDTLGYRKP